MKILLSIEYDGKNYHGWQEQKEPNTIQGKIQEAIYQFSQESIKLVVAGRTDTGVHATGQVAHFETLIDRPREKWLLGLNSFLPEDIRIKNVNSKVCHKLYFDKFYNNFFIKIIIVF